jgi:hypothetical protein
MAIEILQDHLDITPVHCTAAGDQLHLPLQRVENLEKVGVIILEA